MFSALTLVSFVLAALKPALAAPCVAMDASFNLLVFGLNSKDWSAGKQDSWSSSGSAQDITASSRPPFDTDSPQCYLSQFQNAIYVMGADSKDASSVYMYDAEAKSWSKQAVTVGSFDPSSYNAILDRDTNVFYALSKGELFFLNLDAQKKAKSSAVEWTDVSKAPYADGYQPVMALAQNHVHFLNVPSVPTGEAAIFVIHFSYFQPEYQSYPVNGGGTFPAQHGQTASLFQEAVQEEFAFIPDDGSNTYVVNVNTNTTQALPGPSTKDAKASYFASSSAIVQLTSSGAVSYLPYSKGEASTNSKATWSPVNAIAAGSSASASSSPSGTASGSHSGSPTKSATGSSAPQGTAVGGQAGANAGSRSRVADTVVVLAGLSGLAALFL